MLKPARISKITIQTLDKDRELVLDLAKLRGFRCEGKFRGLLIGYIETWKLESLEKIPEILKIVT